MPRITIDGRHVDAPAGATILAAARQLGIDIPTLCFVEGLSPLTTCFVCVVQVVGQRRLLPACATAAVEGMVVISDSPEVKAARRTAAELLLSDHLGECEAPCQISCPASLRVPIFMQELMAGRLDAAAAVARGDLVLPAVLGRICPRFCENTCRRQERDASLAIADLHRHTAERELAAMRQSDQGCGNTRGGPQPPIPASGKAVAIIGAGPAGLAAAFHLLARGHAATLIDQHPEPGGMLRYGLDDTRLPRAILAGEIDIIRRMGGRFRMGCRVGRDVALEQLRREFDAVLLAVGAPVWQRLTCPGQELAESAGELMARIAGGEPVTVGGEVTVVGGGHEAIEVAQVAARRGAARVAVLCPRPESHLPLLGPQIKAAKAAGVSFHFEAELKEIIRSGSRLQLSAMHKGAPLSLECDRLLVAGVRDVELGLLSSQGIATGKRGITADRATLATNVPGVFAAGEAVSGPGFCVRAVAQGHAAAESIDQHLRGRPVVGPAHPHNVRYGKLSDEEKALLLARTGNPNPRTAALADDPSAVIEAERCLICGCQDADLCRLRNVATQLQVDSSRFKGERRAMERDASHPLIVYESHKCIQCGACVAIVESAMAADPAARERLGLTYVGRGFNVRVAVPWGGKLSDALSELNDLARRCAESCPTSAIVLKRDLPKT